MATAPSLQSADEPRLFARLHKLIALFGSPSEREPIAALAAANRILSDAGLHWRDLTDELPREAKTTSSSDGRAAELVRERHGILAAWELSFLIEILTFAALSPRQRRTLAGIQHKISFSRTAA